MNLLSSDPTLTHVTISGNTSAFLGGGMNITLSNPTLTHVTISGNTAPVMGLSSSNAKLINSVFWNNSSESIFFSGSSPTPNSIIINYSDIEGGEEGIITNDNGEVYWLEGNIDTDPLFTDPDNGDYTLQEGSPCIDAGIADIDGAAKVISISQHQASHSWGFLFVR